MANLVQLRRGQTIPEDGALQPYELGYRLVVDKSESDLLHHNDREFYIGEKNLDKETAEETPIQSKRIDLSYFNSDVPCVYIYNKGVFSEESNILPIGSLIIEVETNESGTV